MANVTPTNFQDNSNYGPTATQNQGSDSVILTDGSGNALFAFGTTVPTDGDTGYATGCLYSDTNGGDATSLYVNEGSTSSCDFNAIIVA